MKNKNSKLALVFAGIIMVIFIIFGLLFVNEKIFFNNKTEKGSSKDSGNSNGVTNTSLADKYISLEDINITDKITTKKVKLNLLDDSVTSDFYNQQEEVINSVTEEALDFSNCNNYDVKYNLDYYLNDNILSIVYYIQTINDCYYDCIYKKAVTNIDIVNNVVINEEDLLKNVGSSYESIVNDWYEEYANRWSEMSDFLRYYTDDDYNSVPVTYNEFINDKEKYIQMGLNKIPDIIYTYIKDNKVVYEYDDRKKLCTFLLTGKDGCFNYSTVELGDYNFNN